MNLSVEFLATLSLVAASVAIVAQERRSWNTFGAALMVCYFSVLAVIFRAAGGESLGVYGKLFDLLVSIGR